MPRGSEPAKRRPVIVVQRDELNASALQTVMVITSNLKRARAVGNVLLAKQQTGLKMDTVALASQVETVDKSFVDAGETTLDPRTMERIDSALALTLSLRQ